MHTVHTQLNLGVLTIFLLSSMYNVLLIQMSAELNSISAVSSKVAFTEIGQSTCTLYVVNVAGEAKYMYKVYKSIKLEF